MDRIEVTSNLKMRSFECVSSDLDKVVDEWLRKHEDCIILKILQSTAYYPGGIFAADTYTTITIWYKS